MLISQTTKEWRRPVPRDKWWRAASRFAAVCAVQCALGSVPPACFCQTYTTTFAGSENPLSEGGRWSNNGLDWTTIRKGHGLAYSTQSGIEAGKFQFNDSYAVLSGFPPDQEAWGEAHLVSQAPPSIRKLRYFFVLQVHPITRRGTSAWPGASMTVLRTWKSSGGTGQWGNSRTLPG